VSDPIKQYVWRVERSQTIEVEAATEADAIKKADRASPYSWVDDDVLAYRGEELPPEPTTCEWAPEPLRAALSKIPAFVQSDPRFVVGYGSIFATNGASAFRCPDGDHAPILPQTANGLAERSTVAASDFAPSQYQRVDGYIFGGVAFVDRRYVDAVRELWPDAAFFHGERLEPVVAKRGEEIVALIMPVAT
jgi:hypothetical protein